MISSGTDTRLEEITKSLVNTISPKVLSRTMAAAAVQIIRMLAKGQAVSMQQVAEGCSLPPREAAHLVYQFQAVGLAELDGAGSIVGLILSLSPTSHHFRVAGQELFAWCALDTLFLPAILGRRAEVESVCPVTGARIELAVSPDWVEKVEPSGAVLSLVGPGCTPGITACCGPELIGSQGGVLQLRVVLLHPESLLHPGCVNILERCVCRSHKLSSWRAPFEASHSLGRYRRYLYESKDNDG